jgi:hypothetical protein
MDGRLVMIFAILMAKCSWSISAAVTILTAPEEDKRLHGALAPYIGGGRSRWLYADGIAFKHNVVLAGNRPGHGKAIADRGSQRRVWPRVALHNARQPFQKKRFTLSEQRGKTLKKSKADARARC